MEDNANPELRGVVRRYSHMVAEKRPNDTLSQALGSSARTYEDEGQGRGSTSTRTVSRIPLGNEQSQLLRKQYEKTEDRLVHFNGHFDLGSNRPAVKSPITIEELIRDVDEARTAMNKKNGSGFGQARRRINNFLATMNEYKFLFEIIPNGDKYTFLVTGVISSVVKASLNHKRIAESFSAYLLEISRDIQSVNKSVKVADTAAMRELIVELYAKMFDFLCHAMEWYQSRWRRFKSSWKFESETRVSDKISAIRAVLGRIRHEAEHVNQTRTKEIHHDIQTLKMDMKIAADNSRASPDVPEQLQSLSSQLGELQTLGRKMEYLLVATGEHTIYDQIKASKNSKVKAIEHEVEASDCEEIDDEPVEESQPCPRTYTRFELEEQAFRLDKYMEAISTKAISNNSSTKPMLPREVLVEIQKWTKIPSSNVLWIEGPAYTHFENQLSFTAGHIRELASRAKIPCIFFSAKPKSDSQPRTSMLLSTAQKRQATLIALLYSLVGQLIRLLTHEFESHLKLEEMLGSLDEEFTSAETAMGLIEALFEHAPPMLLIILDKLQLADSQETRPYLIRLVTLLRGKDTPRITKTLFTTAGRCAALAQTINKGEKVDAGRMVQGKPGQPLRGWSSVDDLKFK